MPYHPNNSQPNRQDSNPKNPDPQPSFKFCGAFIPAGVVHYLSQGRITGKELSLIVLIHSMVEYGSDGCYASNAYLARIVGLRNKYSVANIISKLRGLKLIKSYYREGKRYLETTWSRIADPHQTEPDSTECTPVPIHPRNEGGFIPNMNHNCIPSEYSSDLNTVADRGCGLAASPPSPSHVSDDNVKVSTNSRNIPRSSQNTSNPSEGYLPCSATSSPQRVNKAQQEPSRKGTGVHPTLETSKGTFSAKRDGQSPSPPPMNSKGTSSPCSAALPPHGAGKVQREHSRKETPVAPPVGILDNHLAKKASGSATYSEQDYGFAVKLAEKVKGKLTILWISLKKWAVEFTILREQFQVEPHRIDRGLNFLAEHGDWEYCPDIRSGKAFRKKFFALEAAMVRWEKRNPPQVKVSAEAERIVKKLSNNHWPKNSESQLPECVQVSLTTIQDFVKKLTKVESDPKTDYRLLRLVGKLRFELEISQDFVLRYFDNEVHDRIINWDKWSGNLRSFTFGPERLEKWCRAYTVERYGDANFWERIQETLNGVEK